MKKIIVRTMLMIALMLMGTAVAPAQDETTGFRQIIADALNAPDTLKAFTEGGSIKHVETFVDGETICVNMLLGDPGIDFADFDEEEKQAFTDEISLAFLEGIFGDGEDDQNQTVVSLLVLTETKFEINIIDAYGHTLSNVLDFGELNE